MPADCCRFATLTSSARRFTLTTLCVMLAIDAVSRSTEPAPLFALEIDSEISETFGTSSAHAADTPATAPGTARCC